MDKIILKEKLFEAVKQKGLIVEQNNGGKKDFTEMMSLLLHSKTQSHTFHLQCKSYAEHMALNGYYTSIDELTDGLIESYQGKYTILKGYKQYPIEDYKDTTSTINYFKELCDKVTDLRDCCKDTWIQNQIDNVCELINSTLYKLRYLK
jgi:hypothetical protein